MKEAAIKAHKNRKLFMRDISVLPFSKNGDVLPGKPEVLIDPPGREILMSSRVALLRGLRKTKITRNTIADWMKKSVLQNLSELTAPLADGPPGDFANHPIYIRRALVKEKDRQIAEGSISHHGDYAVAVCMAVDENLNNNDEDARPIVDDGSGDPVHEPQWGDKGFLGSAFDDVEEAELELESIRNLK